MATAAVPSSELLEELLEELVLSRNSRIEEAKSKRDKAHQEADRWYQNTTATIAKVYDKLHAQILQFMSKIDLQELQRSLEKIDVQKIDGNLKQGKCFLAELQSSVTSFKKSTASPPKFWSVDVGKITDDFTVDLGHITEPTLKLPDVTSLPHTIRLLSDLPMQPACDISVGMTTNEAVVCFNGQSIIKKITFKSDINDLYQKPLPENLDFECKKFILNDNNVLLRKTHTGPCYILNTQLELVSTIQEDYGRIIDAESTHWVAFHKNDTIQIYDLEQKQLLEAYPSTGLNFWSWPSICRHPDSQVTASVDYGYILPFLCIYDDYRNPNGPSLLHTNKLQFRPSLSNAISSNRRHLYVASCEPVSVFVVSWSGQLVTTLDTQQLGIPKGQYIHNIAVDEDQFTIAVGPGGDSAVVSSFKTFQCV